MEPMLFLGRHLSVRQHIMFTTEDEKYMRRCFHLALNGLGHTRPNPLVGCVIVRNGVIVSEGFHQCIGQNHAERNAILHCKEPSLLEGATLYVNLEPCAHYGHTPPCANLVAESGVKRVVVCNDDPNPKVDGRGYDIVRAAGIQPETGLLREQGRFLNRRFFTMMEQGRPYIILKWAQTADGYMDVDRTDGQPHSYWITCPEARQLSHCWRTQEAAIVVGSQTYLNDHPQLTARLWAGNDPLRLVMDRRGRLSQAAECGRGGGETLPEGWQIMRDGTVGEGMQRLGQQQIQSVIVEGGRRVLEAFLEAGLYDEVRCLVSPMLFHAGTKAPALPSQAADTYLLSQEIGSDRLLTLYKGVRPYEL